jgi:hypothetical protein
LRALMLLTPAFESIWVLCVFMQDTRDMPGVTLHSHQFLGCEDCSVTLWATDCIICVQEMG